MFRTRYDLVIITGPTASGKTSLAAALACTINGEIISADSRQVYRRMNLGTGKDYSDYIVNGRQIPVHLIDIAEPGYKYNVFEYQRDFLRVYNDIKVRGRFPVMCGGSGMYIDSIVSGYKLAEVPHDHELRKELEGKTLEELTEILKQYKKLHNITDVDSVKRAVRAIEIEKYYEAHREIIRDFPALKCLVTGILFDRETQRQRISERLSRRMEKGMLQEVENLLEEGIDSETLMYYGLEYKYITLYLKGKLNFEEMYRKLEIAIHQFAKRQMTWFRGMERKGVKIHWIDGFLPLQTRIEKIIKLLSE
ncbi:MAG: tRNA (adenosine(37)-N6)-dimethylallyltransferase MiaA [Bacteroidales bacterium]